MEHSSNLTYTKLLGQSTKLFKGMEVSGNNHGGVDVSGQERLNSSEHLSSKDDNGGSSVTDLFVLGTRKFNHTLGSGVSNINLNRG